MTVVQTLEFIISAILYLVNLDQMMHLISEKKSSCKNSFRLLPPYFLSCVLMSLFRDGNNPFFYLFATVCFYSCLYLFVLLRHKASKIVSAYVAAIFLTIDSIIQSLGCIIIELFLNEPNRMLIWKTSSIIFNLLLYIMMRQLNKRNNNQIKSSVKLLSRKLYLLILVSLFIIGELCGNITVHSNQLSLSNDIHIFLTTLTILIFLVVIIWFVFSNISKQYYESISKVMEKQVNEQVCYYQKINKLSEDIREFRHDYKNHMICLQALLEGREYDDALEYVKGITRQDIIESNKFFSGNQIADAILSDKAELAKQSCCKIEFDGFISDGISASDLCIILSNALDNAIEACARLPSNGDKIITVKCDILQNVQLMRITNPNDINNSTTETSKEDKENHGFGLYNIRRTVEKHNGQMSIPSQTPLFILDLEFQVK